MRMRERKINSSEAGPWRTNFSSLVLSDEWFQRLIFHALFLVSIIFQISRSRVDLPR